MKENNQSNRPISVQDILEECRDIQLSRNEDYGSAYIKHGKVMKALFPEGFHIVTEKEMSAFGLFEAIVGKVNRMSGMLSAGNIHQDSLKDIINYSAMLLEVSINMDMD